MKKTALTFFSVLLLIMTLSACDGSKGPTYEVDGGLLFYEETEGSIEITGYEGRIENLEIPASISKRGTLKDVRTIAPFAFKDSPLINVIIPDTLRGIGFEAFKNSKSLETVTFTSNSTLYYIEEGAFENTQSLESITLPSGLRYIEQRTFHGSGIQSVDFEDGATLKTIQGSAFENASALSAIELPGTLIDIGEAAFKNTNLTSINLGPSIQYLAHEAFHETPNLTTITIEASEQFPDLIVGLGGDRLSCDYPFDESSASLSIFVPKSLLETYKEDDDWRHYSSHLIPLTE